MKPASTLYKNGLPFPTDLQRNIDTELQRLEENKAVAIIIDGAVGSGKTTLATHLVNYINSKTGHGQISLDIKDHPQIALGGAEFSGCFRECYKQKLKVIIYDEAGDFARRGSLTKFNMLINRFFETYRGFRIIVIMCLPNFNMLDNNLFDNQIPRFCIHINNRGKNDSDFSVYSLKRMNYVRYWYHKLSVSSRVKAYSYVSPNYRGHFLNLDSETCKKLDILSTYGKKRLAKQSEITLSGLISYSDIAQKVNRSVIWVRKEIASQKIKEVKIIDRAKYFNVSVVDMLLSKIEEYSSKDKVGGRAGELARERAELEAVSPAEIPEEDI